MIILPVNDKATARDLLDKAIKDKYTITMLVMGDGNGEDQIANKADVRAAALSSTRRVVWIRDVAILTDAEKARFTNNNSENIICVLSLDDAPVVWLDRTAANSYLYLEKAFLKAQQC